MGQTYAAPVYAFVFELLLHLPFEIQVSSSLLY